MDTEYRNMDRKSSAASLGCCNRLEKFLVWLINFVLFIIGIAEIAAGAWAWKVNASEWTGTSLPKACIAMGILLMCVSFLGCCGAWKESRCMLWLYAFFLFWIILGETGAMSVAAVSENYVERFMAEVWEHLETDDITKIEDLYKCCSFDAAPQADGSASATASQDDVADFNECSSTNAGQPGWPDEADEIPSCYDKAHEDVKKSLKTVLIAVAAVGGIQILILFMTMLLINGITAKTAVKSLLPRSWTGRQQQNGQFGTGNI